MYPGVEQGSRDTKGATTREDKMEGLAVLTNVFQWPGPEEGMHPWMWSWGFHMGLFSMMLVLLFWIAVIIAIVFFIRWLITSTGRKRKETRAGDPAFEILKMRYAKGEINKQEFEEKKRDLGF